MITARLESLDYYFIDLMARNRCVGDTQVLFTCYSVYLTGRNLQQKLLNGYIRAEETYTGGETCISLGRKEKNRPRLISASGVLLPMVTQTIGR